MRRFVLEFEIEDIDEHNVGIDPTDSETLVTEFMTEGHVASHHYFYDDDDKRRALARLTHIRIEEDDKQMNKVKGRG